MKTEVRYPLEIWYDSHKYCFFLRIFISFYLKFAFKSLVILFLRKNAKMHTIKLSYNLSATSKNMLQAVKKVMI